MTYDLMTLFSGEQTVTFVDAVLIHSIVDTVLASQKKNACHIHHSWYVCVVGVASRLIEAVVAPLARRWETAAAARTNPARRRRLTDVLM